MIPGGCTHGLLSEVMDEAIVDDRYFHAGMDCDRFVKFYPWQAIDYMHVILEGRGENKLYLVVGGKSEPYKSITYLERQLNKVADRLSAKESQQCYFEGVTNPRHKEAIELYKETVGWGGIEDNPFQRLYQMYGDRHFPGQVIVVTAPQETDGVTARLFQDGTCNYIIAPDADSCLVARTIYRVGKMTEDGKDFEDICVVTPLCLQKSLQRIAGLKAVPKYETMLWAWVGKGTDYSAVLFGCGTKKGKDEYNNFIRLVDQETTDEGRERVLEETFKNEQGKVEQHRIGRRAFKVAPAYKVTADGVEDDKLVYFVPRDSIKIDIVSDGRVGQQALDGKYYRDMTLRESLSEFYEEDKQYDEETMRGIFFNERSTITGEVFPPVPDDFVHAMKDRKTMKAKLQAHWYKKRKPKAATRAARQDKWELQLADVTEIVKKTGRIPLTTSNIGNWLSNQKDGVITFDASAAGKTTTETGQTITCYHRHGMTQERRDTLMALPWFQQYLEEGLKDEPSPTDVDTWNKKFQAIVSSINRAKKANRSWNRKKLPQQQKDWLSAQKRQLTGGGHNPEQKRRWEALQKHDELVRFLSGEDLERRNKPIPVQQIRAGKVVGTYPTMKDAALANAINPRTVRLSVLGELTEQSAWHGCFRSAPADAIDTMPDKGKQTPKHSNRVPKKRPAASEPPIVTTERKRKRVDYKSFF